MLSHLARNARLIEGGNMSKPFCASRMLPADELVEFLLHGLGDWTGFPSPDFSEIDLAQSNDFGRGSAYEYLIRDVQLIARNRFFDHAIPKVGSNNHQAVARDSLKNAGSRSRVDLPLANHEEIFARAFRNVSIRPKHDRFVKPRALRFCFRENLTHVIT